jgi:DNA-binding MarR family transcriptional regulator
MWSALLRAHRALTNRLDDELRRACDISLDEYDVLYQIRVRRGPVRMTELADAVLVSRASTTRLVDRLVDREWVERWHDDHDRRVVLVRLTDAGRRAQAKAARVHLDGIARLIGGALRAHDLDAVTNALTRLAPLATAAPR